MKSDCRHPLFWKYLNSSVLIDIIRVKSYVNTLLNSMRVPAGLSLRAGGRGFPPDTMNVVLCYFHWKTEEK